MDYYGYYKLDKSQRQNVQTPQTDKFWFINTREKPEELQLYPPKEYRCC